MRTVQDIQHEIERLTKECEEAREREKGPWPRKVDVYAIVSDDALQDAGKEVGLCDVTTRRLVCTFNANVTLGLLVFQNGMAEIVAVNGVAL